LDSLCALISAARFWVQPDPELREKDQAFDTRPFLNVRHQLWLRELRRLVSTVAPKPMLSHSDDLSELTSPLQLPAVHCRKCYATGWASVRPPNEQKVTTNLRAIYEAYFGRSPDTCVAFPLGESSPPGKGLVKQLCGDCGTFTSEKRESCPDCGGENLRPVWLPDLNRAHSRKGETHNRFHNDCPYCGAREGLTIMGSRAASLSNVLISGLFDSTYNDDHKLIAYCFDRWTQSGVDDSAIPGNLKSVLDGIVANDQTRFPHNLICFVQQERGRIFQGFEQLFPELEAEGRAQLQAFLFDESGEKSFGFRLLNRLFELSKQRDSLQAQIKDLTRQRDKLKRINYRTTEETRRFATAVLEGVSVDDLDGEEDTTNDYRSLLHGRKRLPRNSYSANQPVMCRGWLVLG
jgi:ribosomal protein L40E